MALATGTLFEIRATATTGNVNGAGFNTANANMLTDLAATSATGNSPVVTSASYNFAAGDVGAWLYNQGGTNWTPGFYQIASVNAGAATLSAAVGAASQLNTTTNMYGPNTVAGIATVASPTGGIFSIDYSQQDTAQTNATDFAAVGSSTTLTSATAAFTPVMVGNFFHQTTTGTGAFGLTGWYEIVSYTNATTVVLDRTPNNGTASVACTGFVGGAGRFNALEDAFLEMIPAASVVYIKSGTYTISGSIAVSSSNSTATNTSRLRGYNSYRGDIPTKAQRPTIVAGANGVQLGVYIFAFDINFTTTSSSGIQIGASAGGVGAAIRCSVSNTSTTASRIALGTTSGSSVLRFLFCEAVSQNGIALSAANSTNSQIFGCYIHDSVTGFSSSGGGHFVANNIFEACSTISLDLSATAASYTIIGNTIYGTESKIGTGVSLSTANSVNNRLINNIIYGCTTGVSVTTGPALSNLSFYNSFFNNTADVSNWYKGSTDLAINPQFAGATQITGTTATTSGTTLTQSGGDFSSVTDNVDYVRVLSGTGVTVGCYLITGHTSTTLTVNNTLGTSSGGDVVYFVTTGHNFAVTNPSIKGQGFPGTIVGSESTGYMTPGALQPQGSSTTAYTFVG